MKFGKRRSKSEGNEPVRIGDVIPEVVDIDAKTLHRDAAAEEARKQLVAERLAEVLQRTREELIDQRQAGEPVDPEDIAAVGEELQQTIADREALRQQGLPEEPSS